jgi:hypothetical protein
MEVACEHALDSFVYESLHNILSGPCNIYDSTLVDLHVMESCCWVVETNSNTFGKKLRDWVVE